MASPITIHATHPTSHFFREHSAYSDEYQPRRLAESAMGPYRTHPYQRERSHSPPKRGIDYRSTRLRDSAFPSLQSRPPSRTEARMHHHYPAPSQSGASPRPSSMSSDPSRIAVGHLVDGHSSPGASMSQRSLESSLRSPVRGLGERTETGRLPPIESLLAVRSDAPNQHPLPPPPGYRQSHYQSHSAASSMSSAFSEPVSPASYGGHNSRSPVHQGSHPDDRGRPLSNYAYPSREEQSHSSHYEQSRAQNRPPVPMHGHQSNTGFYPPPPPPSGPNTMLPPPPDPYHQNPYASRPPFAYGPPSAPQYGQSWDRPRIDSATPVYEQAVNPGYGWAYPGHHAANSLARKRRGNLPKEATKILKDWFGEHTESPYPTEDQKQELCRTTGLQISQVNNWFINARRRLPREDAKKIVEQGAKDRAETAESADSDNISESAIRYQ